MKKTIARICLRISFLLPALPGADSILHAQTFNAINLDGGNDYISLPNTTPVPTGNSSYTFEAWIKTTYMGNCGIVGWGNWGTGNQVNAFRLSSTGLCNYWWGPDLSVSTASLIGAWHHVAVAFDGTTRAIYLDGVQKGADTPGSHTVPTPTNLRIGSTNNGEYFQGSIDEVRIWNRGLCQSELVNNMHGELVNPTTQSGLVAYYKMNQGAASGSNAGVTTVTDYSSSPHSGTLTNATLSGGTSNWVSGEPSITGDVSQFLPTAPESVNESVTQTIGGTTGFARCGVLASITPSGGGTALSGDVTTKVTVDGSVNTFAGRPYLQRHYDIEPVTNATTATANITLYYSQAEFSAFNAIRGAEPALPVDATDAANNKANLRIYQFHGVPTGGSAPANYPKTWGGAGPARILLTPASVTWNSTYSRWEATIAVTGFSGFFAGTGSTPLPVGLINFYAINENNSAVRLSWTVANPADGKEYSVERSTDGVHFNKIGTIHSGSAAHYTFLDKNPLSRKNCYRLVIVESSGEESYSQTQVVFINGVSDVRLYPVPAGDHIIIETGNANYDKATLTDMQGRILREIPVISHTSVNISDLPAGLYLIHVGKQVLKVVKE